MALCLVAGQDDGGGGMKRGRGGHNPTFVDVPFHFVSDLHMFLIKIYLKDIL